MNHRPEIGYDADARTFTRDGTPITLNEALEWWDRVGQADWTQGAFHTAARSAMGRIGGQARSDRKAQAARENGQKGGRPPNPATLIVENRRSISPHLREICDEQGWPIREIRWRLEDGDTIE